MKCISCELEINPQWTHAIEANVCPFCGKSILEEHLKKLFSVLRDTMEQLLPNYQQQLDDWLISNYNYIKTDSFNLIKYIPEEQLKDLKKNLSDKELQDKKKFTVKIQTENGTEEIQAEKTQSDEKTSDFFKRAEVIKNVSKTPGNPQAFNSVTEKTAHLKEIAKQIKKAGSTNITTSDSDMTLSSEMLENADPEAVSEYQSMMTNDGGEITSALVSDDDVPYNILAVNQALVAKRGNSSSNALDLIKLQQMHNRIQKSKDDFESGANRGKGGFSRSG